MMSSRESNRAKLILIAAGQPDWQGDLPLMAQGLLGMRRAGAWRTTTANLMGSLAIEKFARHYEGTPVAGHTRLQTSSCIHDLDWCRSKSRAGVRTLDFLQPWASKNADTQVLDRSEEHTSELQSLLSSSYAAFGLNKYIQYT